jgi:hypothetical protein
MGHSMLANVYITVRMKGSENIYGVCFHLHGNSSFSSLKKQISIFAPTVCKYFFQYSCLKHNVCMGIGTMWSMAVLLHHFFSLYFLCHSSSDNHMSTFASDKYFGVLLYMPEGTKEKVTVGRIGHLTVFCTTHVILSMASVCHVEFVMQDIGNMMTLGFLFAVPLVSVTFDS